MKRLFSYFVKSWREIGVDLKVIYVLFTIFFSISLFIKIVAVDNVLWGLFGIFLMVPLLALGVMEFCVLFDYKLIQISESMGKEVKKRDRIIAKLFVRLFLIGCTALFIRGFY